MRAAAAEGVTEPMAGGGSGVDPPLLHEILDALTERVCCYRVDDLVISYCNEAWARQFARSPADLIGASLAEVLDATALDSVHRALAVLDGPDEARSQHVPRETNDGTRWDQWVDRVLVRADGTREVLAVARDVTEQVLAETRLRDAEVSVRGALDVLASAVVVFNAADGRVLYANGAFAGMYDHEPETLLGRDVMSLVPPERVEIIRARHAAVLAGRDVPPLALSVSMNGAVHQFEFTEHRLRFGGREALLVMARDVTLWWEARERIAASEARFRTLVDAAPIGITTFTAEGVPDYCNSTQLDLMGLTQLFEDWRDVVHPDDWELAAGALFRVTHGSEHEQVELRFVLADGDTRYVRAHVVPLPDGTLLAMSVDLTERYALEQRLVHEASHDPLTGLANRALLLDRLEQAVRSAQRTGIWPTVLFCDLDRFKPVNDRHGHAVGDEVLRQVAQRLCSTVRGNDTVARLGGDEFVVLSDGPVSADEIDAVAQRILTALHEPFRLTSGANVFLGVSVGIAAGGPGLSATGLLRRADMAVYRAKDGGRGIAARFGDDSGVAVSPDRSGSPEQPER